MTSLLMLLVFWTAGLWRASGDCPRPWPRLDIFVPMQAHNRGHPRYYELEVSFLRTFLFFWPLWQSNTSLTVLYDEEKAAWPCVKDVMQTLDQVEKEGRVPGGVAALPPATSSGTEPQRIGFQLLRAAGAQAPHHHPCESPPQPCQPHPQYRQTPSNFQSFYAAGCVHFSALPAD